MNDHVPLPVLEAIRQKLNTLLGVNDTEEFLDNTRIDGMFMSNMSRIDFLQNEIAVAENITSKFYEGNEQKLADLDEWKAACEKKIGAIIDFLRNPPETARQ